MKIEEIEKESYIEFIIEGSISIENIHLFEEQLEKSVAKKKHLVLVLTDVAYIDSISLGVIILNAKEAEKGKKTLSFVNPNADIHQMFLVTGLNKRLQTYDTVDQAVSSLSS
jgi:anti-anti-sigma factor